MQQELTAHEPKPLFKKVEDAEVASLQKSLEQPSHTKSEIAYDDFSKVDIRVGRVLSAEPVPKSNKLLKIEVDLGFETRTIVSGIAKHYTPEGLLHRNVLVVVNLKPAKLMGVESRGMILAAGDGTLLELPSLQTAPPGTSVS